MFSKKNFLFGFYLIYVVRRYSQHVLHYNPNEIKL